MLTLNDRFVKGYEDDAGADIILTEGVIFKAHSTTVVDLKVKANIPVRESGFLLQEPLPLSRDSL